MEVKICPLCGSKDIHQVNEYTYACKTCAIKSENEDGELEYEYRDIIKIINIARFF